MKTLELEHQNVVLTQNRTALEDLVTKKADSIQALTVSVQNLNIDKERAKRSYNALETKYETLVHSVKDSGGSSVTTKDSIATIPFEGKQYIAHYSGKVKYNIPKDTATWNIDIAFDTIKTQSNLVYEDSLWKIRTTSLTSGVTLRGISTLDDLTLRKIRGVPDKVFDAENTFLGIGGLVDYNRVFVGIVIKPNNWAISVHYKLFDKFGSSDESLQNRLLFGIHYFVF
jgi:hypothetical protein